MLIQFGTLSSPCTPGKGEVYNSVGIAGQVIARLANAALLGVDFKKYAAVEAPVDFFENNL